MLARSKIDIGAKELVDRGNGARAAHIARNANLAWIRGIGHIETPSLFDFQFEDIDTETNKGIAVAFHRVRGLIEQAFTRRGQTVLCVSNQHSSMKNAVTIMETGFIYDGIGYDKLNLCFLFFDNAGKMTQALFENELKSPAF